MNIDQNTLLYFFSTIAQVFGALLGLLGLAYIRLTDDIDKNIDGQLNYLFSILKDSFAKIEKETGKELDISITDINEVQNLIEEHREKLGDEAYSLSSNVIAVLLKEISNRNAQGKSFRRLCSFLVILIILGILGCLITNWLLSTKIVMIFLLVITASLTVLSTIMTGHHFISISRSPRVRSFYS